LDRNEEEVAGIGAFRISCGGVFRRIRSLAPERLLCTRIGRRLAAAGLGARVRPLFGGIGTIGRSWPPAPAGEVVGPGDRRGDRDPPTRFRQKRRAQRASRTTALFRGRRCGACPGPSRSSWRRPAGGPGTGSSSSTHAAHAGPSSQIDRAAGRNPPRAIPQRIVYVLVPTRTTLAPKNERSLVEGGADSALTPG